MVSETICIVFKCSSHPRGAKADIVKLFVLESYSDYYGAASRHSERTPSFQHAVHEIAKEMKEEVKDLATGHDVDALQKSSWNMM